MLQRMHIWHQLITSLSIKQGQGQPSLGLQKHFSRLTYQNISDEDLQVLHDTPEVKTII